MAGARAPMNIASFRLPEKTNTEIFKTKILPVEFHDFGSSDLGSSASSSPSSGRKPLVVFTVGQTGAGKTRLSPAVLSAFDRRPAHFIADTYKTYHPKYDYLMGIQPSLASPATGPDARRWLALSAGEAARRRLDVLLESACRHPDDFTNLADIFRRAGYRIEVVIMAVPSCLSRIGILYRFFENLPEAHSGKLPSRLTPTSVHDDSYAGLLQAAEFLDSSNVADQVIIVRRGNLVAYGAEKGLDGKIEGNVADALEKEGGLERTKKKKGAIAGALERERRRPLTDREMERVRADIQTLLVNENTKRLLDEIFASFPEVFPDEYVTKKPNPVHKEVMIAKLAKIAKDKKNAEIAAARLNERREALKLEAKRREKTDTALESKKDEQSSAPVDNDNEGMKNETQAPKDRKDKKNETTILEKRNRAPVAEDKKDKTDVNNKNGKEEDEPIVEETFPELHPLRFGSDGNSHVLRMGHKPA